VAGAATPALAALTKAGVPHEVVKFEHDPREHSFGVEAVNALTERRHRTDQVTGGHRRHSGIAGVRQTH
jgi:Cys-tRNA(Pro)/Cys-tRNA(Cys) deacylase